ncbi:MAG: hypothetical protein U9R16_08630 [Campylobacterota bacterium]|nr:hypothetical protein [Campylobacterota bacterium]
MSTQNEVSLESEAILEENLLKQLVTVEQTKEFKKALLQQMFV